MKKEYTYDWTRFSADVLKEAADKLFVGVNFKDESPNLYLSIELDDGNWTHDNEEEFFL